jgi:signal-transduction protein with cAMP-binding, CBS, and nucleotidyltransferase domain
VISTYLKSAINFQDLHGLTQSLHLLTFEAGDKITEWGYPSHHRKLYLVLDGTIARLTPASKMGNAKSLRRRSIMPSKTIED